MPDNRIQNFKKKKVLLIGGSLNQTKMMHAVGRELEPDYQCFYSPYYADGFIDLCARWGLADWTVLGGEFRAQTERYIAENRLKIDYRGNRHQYDLVLTGSDLIVPRNIRSSRIVLVQEGMTDPENFMFYLVKWLKLPRYFASTSTNGLSDMYHTFCVASEGYKSLFVRKGADPKKIVVTGIPNYDAVDRFRQNRFPYRNYVLIATSDARETFKWDNRRRFLKEAKKIAGNQQIIVKLHPNEQVARATREVKAILPEALIFKDGPTEAMIANCDTLICQYSTVAYIGLILGKEVHSYFNIDFLRSLLPIQNEGSSGKCIAGICRNLLENRPAMSKDKTIEIEIKGEQEVNHADRHRHSGSHRLFPLTE